MDKKAFVLSNTREVNKLTATTLTNYMFGGLSGLDHY